MSSYSTGDGMGRHHDVDVAPIAHRHGAARSDAPRRQRRYVTGLLGVSLSLALVASGFGVVGPEVSGTSGEVEISSAGWRKSVANKYGLGRTDRSAEQGSRAQRPRPPAAPSSSAAPAAPSQR